MSYKPPGGGSLGKWWTWPITLPWHHEFQGETERGVDLGMPVGVPIYAVGDGVVLTRTDNSHAKGEQPPPASTPNPDNAYAVTGYNTWGGEVDVYRASNYHGKPSVEYYMHLDQLAVKPGDRVKRGQIIGFSGGENSLEETNVVEGYTPTHTANPDTSTAPHLEFGYYNPHNFSETYDPTGVITGLRSAGMQPLPSPCGAEPAPFDVAAFATWVQCTIEQSGGIPQLSNPLDPSSWVAAITSGFGAPLQRIGLIAFGGLLILVGIVVLFFGPVEHAAEQAAPMAALA